MTETEKLIERIAEEFEDTETAEFSSEDLYALSDLHAFEEETEGKIKL